MNETNALIMLQTISLTASICMMLMMGLSKFHVRNKNAGYEKVRGMLFAAAFLLAIQYWAQIHYGFRAQGDDVGAVVNILFYTPVAYLLSCSIIRMSCGGRYMRRYGVVSIISSLVILGVFIAGLILYKSLHMSHALYTMGGVFFLTILFFIVAPSKEIVRMRKKVEDETATDIQNYDLYMKVGTRIVIVLSALVPFVIYSKYALGIFGPVFMAAMFFYMLCFIAMGFNMTPMEVIDDAEQTDSVVSLEEQVEDGDLDEAAMLAIEAKVDKWVETKAFCNPEMSIKIMAMQTDVEKSELTLYLTKKKGATFRIWLSDLRIEEVKKLLLDNRNFTNETVASECGFTSRSWMHQRFKEVTGLTPTEWRKMNRKASLT